MPALRALKNRQIKFATGTYEKNPIKDESKAQQASKLQTAPFSL
jgi:hypothetical protein